MLLSPLTAISPLDGRYHQKVASLAPFFSEYALIRYRVRVEIHYLIALHDTGLPPLRPLSQSDRRGLLALDEAFDEAEADKVKAIERETNHDVKAVEYYLKRRIEVGDFGSALKAQLEFIHFGLTSQDINNTAIPMSLRDGIQTVYLPKLDAIISQLAEMAGTWRSHPMLARTHGQPASPTTLGKEIMVFVVRLRQQRDALAALPYPAKFGGATGNLNAHYIAYPDYDWQAFADQFVNQTLGLSRSFPTTQIDHYDRLAAIFDQLKRINTVLTDLCQDVWLYISQEYFRQEVTAGEVGSSAMPHKVNPIDFENAEGNCGLSTALLEFLSRKLPISRMQRDLTDSTVLRNLGPAMGYALLALTSVQKGLGKLRVNPEAMTRDLEANWAVLAEAIQTILRREGYPKPYEALKQLTRGRERVSADMLREFVDQLAVSPAVKAELRALRPETYLGDAS